MGAFALTALAVATLHSHAPLEIRVSPQSLLVGGKIRVTCRVEPNAENRGLNMGLANYRDSYIDLEGDQAPTTRDMTFDHVPCDTELAYCALTTSQGPGKQATSQVKVGGCHSTDDLGGEEELR